MKHQATLRNMKTISINMERILGSLKLKKKHGRKERQGTKECTLYPTFCGCEKKEYIHQINK